MAHCQAQLEAYVDAEIASADAAVAADVAYAAYMACEASHSTMMGQDQFNVYIRVRSKAGDSKEDIKKSLTAKK